MKKLLFILIAVTALLALRDSGPSSGGSGNGDRRVQMAGSGGDTHLGTQGGNSYASDLFASGELTGSNFKDAYASAHLATNDSSSILRKQGVAAFEMPTGNVYCTALLAAGNRSSGLGTTGGDSLVAMSMGLFST